MKDLTVILVSVVIFTCIGYGLYYVGKTVSYTIFYESMVENTVKEMVKPEYLR